ncbi:helix-turn-helix domain-containing protein [Streptomyces sp. NPDC090077]|uniref:helix-turn-helix domain-containing protein n=1 Tax=Streptomyces sp. NPDC090077 TaxID=3365938 RepID=UPI00382BF316
MPFMTQEAVIIRHHVPVTRSALTTFDRARFKQCCGARSVTMRQVSIASGIPYSAIRSYSTGAANPTPARLAALARVLEVPTTDLAPLSKAPTLHELRWHSGLTVAELAARVGYSESHTASVLAGVSPITDPGRWCPVLEVTAPALRRAWESTRAQQLAGGL